MTVTEVSNLGLALTGLGSHSPNIAIDSDSSNGERADAIVVSDADLLFSGEFRRSGSDLMISKDDRRIVIDDYFKSETRAALATRDGALLSADVVQALSGEVQYAQAASPAGAGAVIGRVSKLTGFATAVRNGVSVQLNLGDNVQKGDVVQTGTSSSLGLVFIDGTVFGLAANARMVLSEMIYDRAGSSNSSLLSLVQGTITFVAGETAKRGDMRVETPAATMGIRGTAVLVEIEFVVPGTGAAPSVRVQVLAEPGGVTGSLVLFSRSSPNTPIGQVSQAGLVTSITGTGDVSTQAALPLSPAAQAIVDQTLREYFPNYRPGGSSTPPGSPDDRLQPDPINFPIDSPTILPLKVNLTTLDLPTDDVTPIRVVTRFNTPPDVSVNDLTVVVNNVGANPTFTIAERVNIVDPDVDNAFHDVQVLYVPNTARLVGVAGPPTVPTTMDLAKLINIDPQTGTISYDPASFAFLAQGVSVGYTIVFDSRSGPDTVQRTLHVTIVGVNDAPVVTSASLEVGEGTSVPLTASSIGITDPDSGSFTLAASNISNGQFEIFSGDSWVSTTTFTSADVAAGHVRFTHDGSESAPTFSVQVHDGFDTSSTFNATIAFNAVNDAPVITSASLAVDEGTSVPLTVSNIGIIDPDTTNFTVAASNISNGQFEIFSGDSWVSTTTFTSADIAAGHIRFTHDGSESAPTFSVQVNDGFDTSSTFDATIAFNAVNDAPVITSASLAVDEGTSVPLTVSNIGIVDPDTTNFTVAASNISNGQFEIFSGDSWVSTTTFTSAEVAAGHIRFTHDGSESAPTFSVQVNDGFDTSSTFDATIAFNNVNDRPVAVADTNWVQEDLHTRTEGNVIHGANHLLGPTGVAFADVADTDAEGESLTLNTVNGSSANVSTPIAGNHGTAWLNPSGSYFYILNNATAQWLDAGETVTDEFTYTVTDGTATSNTSTLTITIFGSSDADNFRFAASVGTAADELASAQGTIDLSMLMTAGNVAEGIAGQGAASPAGTQDTLLSLDDDQPTTQSVLTASLSATDFIVNSTGIFR